MAEKTSLIAVAEPLVDIILEAQGCYGPGFEHLEDYGEFFRERMRFNRDAGDSEYQVYHGPFS